MTITSFFPTKIADQIVWLSNYLLMILVHGPICGIGPEEIASTQVDLRYAIWLLQHWHPATQRDAKDATAHKNLMMNGDGNGGASMALPQPTVVPDPPPAPAPGILKRLFNQIVRIKASAGYTDAIGASLGVVLSASMAEEHPVPEFTLAVELGPNGQRVRIDFNKYGHDGVWIECRINGGDWAFFAISSVKSYFDERPVAQGSAHETREYRMRWWDKSAPHGEWSAAGKVVLGV
jgi:hypothetical protein